jgi:PAS domain S-box-containing protein
MFDFVSRLFDTSDFPARWQCGNWTVGHGWLHVLSDLGVWSAYVAIPCVLGYFVLRRKDIPFRTIFLLFGAFILACGTTHLMEVLMFWWPAYRLAGVIKLFTAVVSWGTVLALVPVTPKALAMRTPEDLEREVAARKEAERALEQANARLRQQVKALRASEERFRLLVDGTNDHAIFMLDPSGRVASWNSGAERIKQYRADEIVGQHFSRFYPAAEVQEGKPDWELRVAAAQGKYEEEGWRLRKDGSRFWASAVITALRDEGGDLRGFSKITRGMTERKQAEESARRLLEEAAARRAAEEHAAAIWEERERLRVTLRSIGDGVIATDAEGRVTLLNPVAEALTGWPSGEATGQPLQSIFSIANEKTREPVENPVIKVLREGTVVGLANHTVLVSKQGVERPIDDSAAPIRDDKGKLLGVVLVFRDVTEQRRAEESQRNHQEVLKLVHQVGRIGHWEWNSLTDENNWSPEIEALYGLPPGGFEGGYQGWAKLLHPDDLPKAEEDVRRALETGKYFTEFRVIWPDGSVHWLEARAIVFKDGHGKPVRIVGVNMDITERKRQEEALRAGEQRWRTMAEALPNLVWTDLPDGRCDWLSSQWGKYTGIPEQELLGLRWLDTVIHPDDRERTLACWQAACADEADYDLEYRIRRYDGEYHWFKTRGVPVRNEQGKIVYWFGTCTDIEDTKRIGERLRLLWEAASVLLTTTEPEAMLRELFAKIGPHLGLDTYFNYMVNETGDALRLVSYIGIPEEAARQITRLELGRAICGTVAVQRQPFVATHIQQSDDPKAQLVKSFGIRAYAWNPLQIDNDLVGTLSFASRSRDELDANALDFLQTICHYVAVAYERLRLVKQLREADRKKDEFLATLAHELRNPLAPIRNAVELLERSGDNATLIGQARSIVRRQLDQMVRLIDDLLDMSRISQGKVQIRKERVDLAAVIRTALETARPLIDAQAHELTVTLPLGPIHLDADPTRLAQVIANLLHNAAKYTAKGGHIWLTVERQGAEAIVAVRDTGIGIAAEHLPGIFEMFSQVAPALERSHGGLGIGLSLVRGLVELHGGTVEARSDGPGRGSEFLVRLPVADGAVRPGPEPTGGGEPSRAGPKRRILVVDDNRDAADSMALMLQLMGHDARTAYDGLEAVQAAATYRPDVLLLDIGLPKMNGYEVARHIRRQRWGEGMVLTALTGWGQEEDKRRALEAGFDHHLTKPVDAPVLEKLLALMHPLPPAAG